MEKERTIRPLDILEELGKDWDALYPRLLRFSRKHINILQYYGEKEWNEEDLVTEAIDRALQGKRKWNPEAYKNVKTFLYGVIKSLVSDRIEHLRKFSGHRLVAVNDDEKDYFDENFQAKENSPEEKCLEKQVLDKILSFLFEQFESDDNAFEILACFSYETYKPSEIAAETGLSISEVDAVKKRIKRKLRLLDEDILSEIREIWGIRL